MLHRNVIQIDTKEGPSDITKHVENVVNKSHVKNGICNIFLRSTTSSIMINENDVMLFADYKKLFEQVAPENRMYAHTDNARSHLLSSLVGNEKSVPVSDGKLLLGKWQSIILWEFDKPRRREIIVSVIGE